MASEPDASAAPRVADVILANDRKLADCSEASFHVRSKKEVDRESQNVGKTRHSIGGGRVVAALSRDSTWNDADLLSKARFTIAALLAGHAKTGRVEHDLS
jgi:hypothetical protein